MQTEITFLLDHIEQTECRLIRNGKAYPGAEAVAHVKAKYKYFADRIDSTEKFIELSASRSSLTGRNYEISCAGKEALSSQRWLLIELDRYRKTPNNVPPLPEGDGWDKGEKTTSEPGRSVHQNADKH